MLALQTIWIKCFIVQSPMQHSVVRLIHSNEHNHTSLNWILTEVVCWYSLNFSMVEFERLMSLNIPSSLLVNWHPHSVCGEGNKGHTAHLGLGPEDTRGSLSQPYTHVPVTMHYLRSLARRKVRSRIRPCCDSSPVLHSKSPPPPLPSFPSLISFKVIIAVQVILYVTLHFHYLIDKAGLPLTACLPKEDSLRESPTLLAATLNSVSFLPLVPAFWLSGLAHILWLSSTKSVQYISCPAWQLLFSDEVAVASHYRNCRLLLLYASFKRNGCGNSRVKSSHRP